MINGHSHISYIGLYLVLACLLFFALYLSDTAISSIEPEKVNTGTVCFDAIIELNSYLSSSFLNNHK